MPRSRSRRHSRHRSRYRNKYRLKTPSHSQKHRHRSRQKHFRKHHHRRRERNPSQSSSSSSSYSKSRGSSSSSSSYSSLSQNSSPSFSSSSPVNRKAAHFQYKLGEKIGHKYRVTCLLGTGTFGRVVEGRYEGKEYAIKVIKAVERYTDSAKTERRIIKELCYRDPKDEKHLVRYYQSFYHYNHFCLVFELLGPSLYDIIKKNKYVGFPPAYVQSFARQLFQGVGFMHKQGYTHTDLKLENILASTKDMIEYTRLEQKRVMIPSRTDIKLIDFGGATHQSENHTEVINTRQYRCPEVLLKCYKWNELSDIWSLGCILAELATGNLLFPIHKDVDHIYLIDKLIGKIPRWMSENSDEEFKKYLYPDGSINYRNAQRDIGDWETVKSAQSLQIQLKGYERLEDLIRSCLIIDPKKRMTCQDVLRHPYFSLDLNSQRNRLLISERQ